MNFSVGKMFKGDKVLWIVLVFLSLISLLIVYSATGKLAYRRITSYNVCYTKLLRKHSIGGIEIRTDLFGMILHVVGRRDDRRITFAETLADESLSWRLVGMQLVPPYDILPIPTQFARNNFV